MKGFKPVAHIPAGAIAVLLIGLLTASAANAVPSFARQTGLACQACHTVFPELTPFGRTFKLNAYQIDNLPQIQGITPSKDYELLLNQVPALSMMFQTSYTSTSKAVPDSVVVGGKSQDGQFLFPQQASIFYAGRIAPGLGAFIQMTYASDSGSFGWDNTEFRYAKQIPLGGSRLTVGATINNNPTVQDPWNSTPAWQTPFDQKTSAAPSPGAAAMIDGGLGGSVAGITGYLWWNNSVYAEFGMYHSAPQGVPGTQGAGPLDSASGGALSSWAPYWRLAYERQWDRHSASVGAYGMVTRITPGGLPVGSASDKYNDWALDGQYQYIGDEHIFSVQTTYIKETQTLDATFGVLAASANASNDLKTFRLGTSYYYRRTFGGGLGYFTTSGSTDTGLWATAAPPTSVNGFANGSPNSNGWTGELDYMAWQNVKLALQYTVYNKFNGGSTNYDGNGRNASDNNTLYLLGWFTF